MRFVFLVRSAYGVKTNNVTAFFSTLMRRARPRPHSNEILYVSVLHSRSSSLFVCQSLSFRAFLYFSLILFPSTMTSTRTDIVRSLVAVTTWDGSSPSYMIDVIASLNDDDDDDDEQQPILFNKERRKWGVIERIEWVFLFSDSTLEWKDQSSSLMLSNLWRPLDNFARFRAEDRSW